MYRLHLEQTCTVDCVNTGIDSLDWYPKGMRRERPEWIGVVQPELACSIPA